jgi:hypothetical protein
MVTVEEAARALQGVLRIALFDRAGASSFGRDPRSCARSFWAYAIALPATLLLLSLDVLATKPDQPELLAAARLVSDVIQAAGFPLLLLPLLGWFGRGQRWAWFVTAYNWYSMAQTITLATLICVVSDLPGADFRFAVIRAAQIYVIVLEAFLADAVLDIGAWRAAIVVMLDWGFGLGVDRLADWIAL